MQARRVGFVTERAALVEYRRLSRRRDACLARLRVSGPVQAMCEDWLRLREQELQPNSLYNYTWLLGLVFPYIGKVRASRLSARMAERAYRDLERAGYSRSTLRTLDLVLCKAFAAQTGRTLGAHKPRESDEVRPVWTLPRPAVSLTVHASVTTPPGRHRMVSPFLRRALPSRRVLPPRTQRALHRTLTRQALAEGWRPPTLPDRRQANPPSSANPSSAIPVRLVAGLQRPTIWPGFEAAAAVGEWLQGFLAGLEDVSGVLDAPLAEAERIALERGFHPIPATYGPDSSTA